MSHLIAPYSTYRAQYIIYLKIKYNCLKVKRLKSTDLHKNIYFIQFKIENNYCSHGLSNYFRYNNLLTSDSILI